MRVGRTGFRKFLNWLAAGRLRYSAGITITEDTRDAILTVPAT
jgi:hypothetical protein